jgi:hypothetical protein
MLIALTLLFSAPQSLSCASYEDGQRELRLGTQETHAKHYRSAYRHFQRGLSVTKALYRESAGHIRGLKDDSVFTLSFAENDAREGNYRKAANGLRGVLFEDLELINQVHRCR